MDELTITYILLSVIINSIAQIIFKKGAKIDKKREILKILFTPKIIIGLILFASSALIWVIVLGKADVTYAYPLLSLGYILTTILSYTMLKEKITKNKILGIIIIIIGVILVGVSK